MEENYLILKYYHYTPINDPQKLCKAQTTYCTQKRLKGRIKIAKEGINGTLSGLKEDCTAYMEMVHSDLRFADMVFNITPWHTHVHEKLHVYVKEEILTSRLPKKIMPSKNKAERFYVDAATFQKMCSEENCQIVDVRNKIEHQVGHFKNAVTFDMQAFRELPIHVKKIKWDKNKKYIVVCTRGIKSEKARDYLKKELHLPHVYHLEGGILDYAKNTNGAGFQGVCYVYDNRLVVPINQKSPTIISHCHHCQEPSIRMINCANPTCNLHTSMCASCSTIQEGACSAACRQHPKKRSYNGTGYYVKKASA